MTFQHATHKPPTESVVVDLLAERDLTISVAEANISGLLSSWLGDADPQGRTFRGGWVLPDSHGWTLSYPAATGQDSMPSHGTAEQALCLAQQVCTVTGASVGIGVVNTGPDHTYISVSYDGQVHERVMRFREHGSHAHHWVASTALDLVRRVSLGLTEPA